MRGGRKKFAILSQYGTAERLVSFGECKRNVVASMREIRFCSHQAFKHAPLLRVPLCVSWAFIVDL